MKKLAVQTSLTWVAGMVVMSSTAPARAAADAGTKTLIDYFLPTPIVCPLISDTWGAPGVVPRDVCNGLEDSTGQTWQYWDGKILQGADGKYHMYAGRWPQDKGFADWPNSVIVEAVSNATLMGSYVPLTTTPFNGKEQNVTGMPLIDGSFALIDSPGNIYTATSLDGPWASLGAIQITANGSTISTQTTENQTLWQRADGSFLIVSRSFQDMVSSNKILGPYVIQSTIPDLESEGYEDPVIWCSGGQYHLVANMYNARKAMHFTSNDGVSNWTNRGLAYDPTTNFVRYTDGTVNNWYKAERPGVFMQSGHVTAFSFAVIDVDKTLDLGNDNHGSKIIVVPFDGVTFDLDNPGPGSPGCPLVAIPPMDAGAPVDASNTDANKADASGAGDSGGSTDAGASRDAGEPFNDAGANARGPGEGGGGGVSTNDDETNGRTGAASNAVGCSCQSGKSASHGASGAGVTLLVGLAVGVGRRRRRDSGHNEVSGGARSLFAIPARSRLPSEPVETLRGTYEHGATHPLPMPRKRHDSVLWRQPAWLFPIGQYGVCVHSTGDRRAGSHRLCNSDTCTQRTRAAPSSPGRDDSCAARRMVGCETPMEIPGSSWNGCRRSANLATIAHKLSPFGLSETRKVKVHTGMGPSSTPSGLHARRVTVFRRPGDADAQALRGKMTGSASATVTAGTFVHSSGSCD